MKYLPLLLLLLPCTLSLSSPPLPPLSPPTPTQLKHANNLLEYIAASPDPYHCTATSVKILVNHGFQPLDESRPFDLKPNGRYYYTREKILGSSLVAFIVPPSCKVSSGLKILGAHTDSPNLRVRPLPSLTSEKLSQVSVETYGGGLWHTWFDRDLSLCGKVITRGADDSLKQHLVNLKRPLLKIPNLAIHLQTPDERAAFIVNKEDHLQPIIATATKENLPDIPSLLAAALNVNASAIVDFDLSLFDTQEGLLTGANSDFISASRLDNQASCYMALTALVDHADSDFYAAADDQISLVALFDHEEVGSASTVGAGGTLIEDAFNRIAASLGAATPDLLALTARNSFIISLDQAHASHPNYKHKHEKHHRPRLNEGLVIKTNNNQRDASTGTTSFVVREIGRKVNMDVQEFVVRNDCVCGSTIGPIISAKTGVRAVDIGAPQFAMHSIRETMGSKDVMNGVELLSAFFGEFKAIDTALN